MPKTPRPDLHSITVRGAKILLRLGSALLGAGLLMVAFVAYQLWGTALYEHGAQSNLRHELAALLGRELVPRAGGGNAAGSPGSSTAPSTSTTRPTPATTRPAARATTTTSTSTTTTTVPVIPQQAAPAPQENSHPGIDRYMGYVAPVTGDPAVGGPIGYLSIPKIGLDDAIVEGVGEAQLQQGPGHYPGTPLPGESGNASIAGHRTTYAAPFYNLNELQPGDPIYVQTTQGTFTYDVTDSFAVLPTNVSVLDPTPQPTLTLTTCNPRYSASQRLIVKASLVGSQPPPGTQPTTVPAEPPAPARHRATLAGDAALAGGGGGVALTIVWGAVTVVLAAGWVVVRRLRSLRPQLRLGVLVIGAPLVLGSLFLFFAYVSTALPGSF